MSLFFTSDHHFGHARIIELARRPFDSVEEMNERLIENWNEVVHERDIVYHLGDFTLYPRKWDARHERDSLLRRITPRLNGRKIFIEGNHDDYNEWPLSIQEEFEIGHKRSLQPKKFAKVPMLLTHRRLSMDPAETQHGTINLHGHHHSMHPTPPPYIDVGVDAWDFTPVHLDQIIAHLQRYGWGNWKNIW